MTPRTFAIWQLQEESEAALSFGDVAKPDTSCPNIEHIAAYLELAGLLSEVSLPNHSYCLWIDMHLLWQLQVICIMHWFRYSPPLNVLDNSESQRALCGGKSQWCDRLWWWHLLLKICPQSNPARKACGCFTPTSCPLMPRGAVGVVPLFLPKTFSLGSDSTQSKNCRSCCWSQQSYKHKGIHKNGHTFPVAQWLPITLKMKYKLLTWSLSAPISFPTLCNFTYCIHLHWLFSALIYETRSYLGNFAFIFIATWNNTSPLLNAHPVSLLKCQIKSAVFGKAFANHTSCRSFLIPNYLPSHHHIPTSQSKIILFLFPWVLSVFLH